MATASHVYVGVGRWAGGGALSGVFRQEVGDLHWERMTKGMPDDVHVHAITVHPADSDVVYAGTSNGPYRSVDRGGRWERLGFPEGVQIWSIQPHRSDPRVLYAGASPVAVFRSEDGGDNWARLADPALPERVKCPFASRVMRIALDPRNDDYIFATIEVGGAMRSLDGGRSWSDCSETLVRFAEQPKFKSAILTDSDTEGMLDGHALCISEAEPDALIAALRMGLFRSTDRGASWRDMEIGRFSPLTYSRDIRVSPQDPRTLYACLSPAARSEAGTLYRSRDVGRTWERFDHSVTAHSTMMAVALHPRDPDAVFSVSRGGQAFGTTDGGKTWRESRLPEGCNDVYAAACG
jgi:photosystem II stability/assembly factor-like uncharacterized protein